MDNSYSMGCLAPHARQYGKDGERRPPADPLGLDGFPRHRAALDFMVRQLCRLLQAGGTWGGRLLATRIFQDNNTRHVRRLVAYARVHHRIHQIVGLAGAGYLWAEADDERGRKQLATAVATAMRMGRCFFFIAALHRRQGTAMAAVQMTLDFMKTGGPGAPRDELAAMVAAEGAGMPQFLDALISSLATSDDGLACLKAVGSKHAAVLVPAPLLTGVADQLEGLAANLRAAG